MQIFDNCICIAQARVIEGKRKKAHICTIAFHETSNSFVRICLPFDRSKESNIRRWNRFSFRGKADPSDTRLESFAFAELISVQGKINEEKKRAIHRKILQKYKHEKEYNESKQSIGVLLFEPGSVRFKQKPLTDREEEYRQIMADKGLFFPSFKLYISGKSSQFKSRFEKQFVQWDFFEAIRKGNDPLDAYNTFLEPYIILGNTPWKRDSFMAISILSAPLGYKRFACEQQLSLMEA